MTKNTQKSVPAQAKALYTVVDTYNAKGEQVGSRIVDMYHYGTRKWLADHTWWAMHNGCLIEQRVADAGEVEAYVADQQEELARKYAKSA